MHSYLVSFVHRDRDGPMRDGNGRPAWSTLRRDGHISALRQDTVETERIEWARETHESRDSCFTELLTLFIVVLYCKY